MSSVYLIILLPLQTLLSFNKRCSQRKDGFVSRDLYLMWCVFPTVLTLGKLTLHVEGRRLMNGFSECQGNSFIHTTVQIMLIPLNSYIYWVLMKILIFVNKTDLIFTNVCINVTMQTWFCLHIRGAFEKQRGWNHKKLMSNRNYKLFSFSKWWALCLTHLTILFCYASMQSWKHYPGILRRYIVIVSTHGKRVPWCPSWVG